MRKRDNNHFLQIISMGFSLVLILVIWLIKQPVKTVVSFASEQPNNFSAISDNTNNIKDTSEINDAGFNNLIAINANKKRVVKAIELLSPHVNAVRREASVKQGEPRFAEPTWLVGEAHFGIFPQTAKTTPGMNTNTDKDTAADIDTDTELQSTFFIPVNGSPINEVMQAEIKEANKEIDITLKSARLIILIPQGFLTNDMEINSLIVNRKDLTIQPGLVVAVTDSGGNQKPLTWSMVTEDMICYITTVPGKYEIIANNTSFLDVLNHWSYENIQFITAHELFLGNSDELFAPDEPMTRAMFVTVLGRFAGINPDKYLSAQFTDVEPGSWYSAYVQWAYEENIVLGYENNTFGVNDPITREQMCTILVSFMKKMKIQLPKRNTTKFRDTDSFSSWSVDAISTCASAGLISGTGSNLFEPLGDATRAEVATILTRTSNLWLLAKSYLG